MNDRRPEPNNKSIENQRKVIKTFAVLFGFIVAPALAVGYAFLLGWPNWALLSVLVSVGLIQLWAYRKRPLLGRSQRRLVFTTVVMTTSTILGAVLGWWTAMLTITLAIVWYSQYQMWHSKSDPWESITIADLPSPKVPKALASRINDIENVKSVERQSWMALIGQRPNRDDVTAFIVMSSGILLAGLFAIVVLKFSALPTLAIALACTLIWLVIWWLMIYLYTYIVCDEESIRFFEATPWGSEIRPVMFKNILIARVDPKYWARRLGYVSIEINTAAQDGDEDVNKALKFVKFPGKTWLILRR